MLDYNRNYIFNIPTAMSFLKSYILTRIADRVFTNGPGKLGSIPSQDIPKTLKMVLDASLLNTQQ